MSQFEFVQITFAIILGLGVTTILNGLGEQLRQRHTHGLYPLQVASSLLLLLVHLAWLWGFWQTRQTDWHFGLFLAYAIPSVCLALAANVSRIDTSAAAQSSRDQYFRNAPVLYSLWAGAECMGILLGLHYASGLEELDRFGLITFSIIRLVGAGLTLSMGFVKRTGFQWAVLSILFLLLAALVVVFITDLPGS